MAKSEKQKQFDTNCPISEVTADGTPCGRCWYWCRDGICPRHGDVKEAITKHLETGKLTWEEA
jgi:hypothetical protein